MRRNRGPESCGGVGEWSALPTNENRYASGRADQLGRWCEMNCTRGIDSRERRAYGAQPMREPEKW